MLYCIVERGDGWERVGLIMGFGFLGTKKGLLPCKRTPRGDNCVCLLPLSFYIATIKQIVRWGRPGSSEERLVPSVRAQVLYLRDIL